MRSLLINITYIIEAFCLCLWIAICRLIGIDFASSLGSKIVKFIGPLSKFDTRAEKNLKKIFPTLNI
jgi:lauroyl/myristoyl acyltransferase